MNIGCCITIYNPKGIAQAKSWGIDFVETSFQQLALCEEELLESSAALFKELKLPCIATNEFMPGSYRLTGPEADLAAAGEYVYKALERTAKKIGYKYVVFGSGGARNVPEGFPKEKATEQLITFLSDYVAPAMKQFGVTCVVEELCDSNILTSAAEAAAVVKAVNKPEIQLLLDYYHFVRAGESVEDVASLVPFTKHVHVASPSNGRKLPKVNDGDDYKSFFDMLRSNGYGEGNVSLEGTFADNFEGSIRDALTCLKAL